MQALLCAACVLAALSNSIAVRDASCPAPPSASGIDFELPCVLHSPIPEPDGKVHFAPGSAALSDDARAVLDRQAEVLARFPEVVVETLGFADTTEAPTASAEAALSLERATAVRDYLIRKGIAASRVSATGHDYAPIIPREVDAATLAAMRVVWTLASDP